MPRFAAQMPTVAQRCKCTAADLVAHFFYHLLFCRARPFALPSFLRVQVLSRRHIEVGPLHTAEELRQAAAQLLDQKQVCSLSLLPLVNASDAPLGGTTLNYCGKPFHAACANFWINRISVSPPETTGSWQV